MVKMTVKEPEITLFGRKIALPETEGFFAGGECSDVFSEESGGSVDFDRCFEVCGRKGGDDEKLDRVDEDQAAVELSVTTVQDEDQDAGAVEELQDTNALSDLDCNLESASTDGDAVSVNHPKAENEQTGATNKQQKPLKKPDKILLCPRCKSMDTKFCYYNNYNIKQPRHFCKSCQRYWTAGGTMRNVPVGAGRRKSKSSASHCHHMIISDTLQAGVIKQKSNVLSFDRASPLYESMSFALNATERRVSNGVQNSHQKIDQQGSVSGKNGENIDECLVGSCDGDKNQLPQHVTQNVNGFLPPVHCIPVVPWPFPWNSGAPFPAICPPGYPLPYYPTMYWNCGMPNAWNFPWLPAPSFNADKKETSSSSPDSPLGKHSRNGELLKTKPKGTEPVEPKDAANSIVVPKTLRIDNPEEAAKSSIWTTLGNLNGSSTRESLFKALQPKIDKTKDTITASPLLLANPAALSRSMNFRESA